MGFVVGLSFLAFFYLILAAQVASGFPPFYKPLSISDAEKAREVMPYMLGMVCAFGLGVLWPPLFAVVGGLSLWCTLRLRQRVKQERKGPRMWVITPLTVRVFTKWPMLLFDLWTVGVTAVFAAVVIASG